MVLKLTLCCLVRMGYQCTFGVLQVGITQQALGQKWPPAVQSPGLLPRITNQESVQACWVAEGCTITSVLVRIDAAQLRQKD